MKKRIMLIVLFCIFIFFMESAFAVDNDTGILSDMKTTDSTSNSHNYYSDNGKEYSNGFQEKNINNKNLNNNSDENQDLDDNIRATTWYVNPTTGNDNNAGNTASAPFKTILKAITVSTNGNTIFLQNGTYYTSKHNLTKNLVFEGQSRSGVTIHPNYNHLFNITNGKVVTLRNLRIMNGGNTANATIMLCSSSKLTVSNCQFDNCNGGYGSAIRNTEPNVQITISSSSFINNRASKLGGAILNTGNSATTSLTNCIFTTNKMTAASYNSGSPTCGGAVYFGGQSSNTVSGCTFSGNEAFNGGAVYCANGNSNTIFSNNVFTTNYARYSTSYGYGGGIMVGAGHASFNGLTFNGNQAIRGGGLSINSGSTYTITSSKFENNVAHNYGGACNFYGKITLQNSNLTNNIATKYGGAVFNTGTQDIITINNCRFVSNKALESGSTTTSYGGAIASSGISSQYTILNCIFNTNQAHRGGAISSRAENIIWTINNTRFNNNNVSQHGGAICVLKESNTFQLADDTFTSNRANQYGGAILSDGLNSNIRLTSCNFTSNVAGQLGGAIYNQKNTTITGRYNSYLSNSVTLSTGSGGAICNKEINSRLSLLQERYRNNVAFKGSAICNYATNCRINCSILHGNNPLIYSQYSMDARFNWWGSNNGNYKYQGTVDTTKPVVFLFSVTNMGVSNNIRTINVFVSVYNYNDSGVLKTMDLYIPYVQIVLSNNLGTITTNYQTTVRKTLSASITSITATLDNQPLTVNIVSKTIIDGNKLPEQYDDIIDLNNITITQDDEHIGLFIDGVGCELTDLLLKEFSDITLGNTRIIIENKTLKFKYNDECTHNVSVSRMYFTDETLSENIPTTIITKVMGIPKPETIILS